MLPKSWSETSLSAPVERAIDQTAKMLQADRFTLAMVTKTYNLVYRQYNALSINLTTNSYQYITKVIVIVKITAF